MTFAWEGVEISDVGRGESVVEKKLRDRNNMSVPSGTWHAFCSSNRRLLRATESKHQRLPLAIFLYHLQLVIFLPFTICHLPTIFNLSSSYHLQLVIEYITPSRTPSEQLHNSIDYNVPCINPTIQIYI